MREVDNKEKLVRNVKEVIADAEAVLRETAGDLTGKAKDAQAKLIERLEDVKEKAQEMESTVRERALEGARDTDKMIRKHPYESIGVAFGVGLLIGVLLNHK